MGRLGPIIVVLSMSAGLWAKSPSRYQAWEGRQSQGDFAGAMDILLEILAEQPGDSGAMKKMSVTAKAIEKRARELEVLSREDRLPAVSRALTSLDVRERQTRQALNTLRNSYEHQWRTTPESLLHTCRGVELQVQITLPDDPPGLRRKEYLRDLCVSLSAGVAAGIMPGEVDIHRVAGFLAYQRMDLIPALTEWKKALLLAPRDKVLAGFVRDIEQSQKNDERRSLARKKISLADQKYSEGNFRAALSFYRDALALDPSQRFAAEEIKRLEKIVKRESDRASLGRRLSRAREAEANGRRAEAVREWLAVLKEDPLNTEAREKIGKMTDVWETPSPKPSKTVARSSDQNRERAAALYSRGLMDYSQGDLKEARNAFAECVKLNPSDEMAVRALERVTRQLRNSP